MAGGRRLFQAVLGGNTRSFFHGLGRLRGWALVVSIVLCGCGSSVLRPEFTVEQRVWTPPHGPTGIQWLTDHYDFRMTAKDEVLVEALPEFMETTFAEYGKLIPPALESSDRLRVYLFDDRPQWADFTRAFVPAQAYMYLHIQSGGYMDHPTQTSVIFDIGRDRTLALLAHEGLHQYLARFFPEPVPAWLNEGLATQWEAFELDGYRPVYTPFRNFFRKNDLREALGPTGDLIPLCDLLRMNAGDAVVQAGQPTRAYYAQVWSLVLFLREGQNKTYLTGFQTLLADVGTQRLRQSVGAYRAATPGAARYRDSEVVFRHYITEDLDAFVMEYETFARQLVN